MHWRWRGEGVRGSRSQEPQEGLLLLSLLYRLDKQIEVDPQFLSISILSEIFCFEFSLALSLLFFFSLVLFLRRLKDLFDFTCMIAEKSFQNDAKVKLSLFKKSSNFLFLLFCFSLHLVSSLEFLAFTSPQLFASFVFVLRLHWPHSYFCLLRLCLSSCLSFFCSVSHFFPFVLPSSLDFLLLVAFVAFLLLLAFVAFLLLLTFIAFFCYLFSSLTLLQ